MKANMKAATFAAASVAAMLLAVSGVLLAAQDVVQQRTVLTSYQPRALRWPGWLDSFPEAKPSAAPPATVPPRPELVGMH